MATLKTSEVQKLDKAGRYGDGNGLYLVVSPGGSKSWVQRIQVDGKRLDKGLGGYPTVTVTQARRLADANRVDVRRGRNPWAAKAAPPAAAITRAAPTVPTFAEAARKVHALNAPTWKNGKHISSWIQTLERHVFPDIGDRPIDEITRRDVLDILLPLWHELPETSDRLRQRMRTVFAWAMSSEYVDANPAGEGIDGALPKRKRLKAHLKAMPYQDVPAAFNKIHWSDAQRETICAFEFLILTAARSIEVRGAAWDEIDMQGALWTIRGDRMKSGAAHLQPLSEQALGVLFVAQQMPGDSGLVFPRKNGGAQSENTFINRVKKDGLDCHPHGFRSSFRDWAEEQTEVNASHAAIELCLAHRVGSAVEKAYFRSDLLDQRRALMQSWGDFIAKSPMPF